MQFKLHVSMQVEVRCYTVHVYHVHDNVATLHVHMYPCTNFTDCTDLSTCMYMYMYMSFECVLSKNGGGRLRQQCGGYKGWVGVT